MLGQDTGDTLTMSSVLAGFLAATKLKKLPAVSVFVSLAVPEVEVVPSV